MLNNLSREVLKRVTQPISMEVKRHMKIYIQPNRPPHFIYILNRTRHAHAYATSVRIVPTFRFTQQVCAHASQRFDTRRVPLRATQHLDACLTFDKVTRAYNVCVRVVDRYIEP